MLKLEQTTHVYLTYPTYPNLTVKTLTAAVARLGLSGYSYIVNYFKKLKNIPLSFVFGAHKICFL